MCFAKEEPWGGGLARRIPQPLSTMCRNVGDFPEGIPNPPCERSQLSKEGRGDPGEEISQLSKEGLGDPSEEIPSDQLKKGVHPNSLPNLHGANSPTRCLVFPG